MKRSNLALAVVATALLSACAERSEVRELSQRLEALEAKVSLVEQATEDVKTRQGVDRLVQDAERVAYLTPASDGYSALQTDIGPITLTLSNVEPYANGTRVTLRVGNPMSATINDASATVEWGSVGSDGQPQNDIARSRRVQLGTSLRPGAWTNVQLVLDAVQPAQLGFVRVRDVESGGISLLR